VKRLTIVLAALSMVPMTALPALAQGTAGDQYDGTPGDEEIVSATGVIEKPDATSYMYGTHAMTDEASGTLYALTSDRVNLDDYTGERVTVYGTVALEEGELEGGPALISVDRVEPAQDEAPGEESIRGFITSIMSDRVLVEEDPGEYGSAKGFFTLTDETEILRRQNGELTEAGKNDLRAGQLVEATYSGPVAESYPTQGTASRIVILEDAPGGPGQYDDPAAPGSPSNADTDTGLSTLPATGGAEFIALGAGALLIAAGAVIRRVFR
jgi:hypothetical protein